MGDSVRVSAHICPWCLKNCRTKSGLRHHMRVKRHGQFIEGAADRAAMQHYHQDKMAKLKEQAHGRR